MPMSPLPPGAVVHHDLLPERVGELSGPMVRASVSMLPPGANGTTNRTGRVGYCCASAGGRKTASAAHSNMNAE